MSSTNGNRYSTKNRFDKATKMTERNIKCRICYDAGKGADMYMAHSVREVVAGRTVVCPTLMASECRKCHRMGHTVSRCPVSSIEGRITGHYRGTSSGKSPTPPVVCVPVSKNTYKEQSQFGMLAIDSSESEDECDYGVGAEYVIPKKASSSWYDSDGDDE